jgi:hypothetical protein
MKHIIKWLFIAILALGATTAVITSCNRKDMAVKPTTNADSKKSSLREENTLQTSNVTRVKENGYILLTFQLKVNGKYVNATTFGNEPVGNIGDTIAYNLSKIPASMLGFNSNDSSLITLSAFSKKNSDPEIATTFFAYQNPSINFGEADSTSKPWVCIYPSGTTCMGKYCPPKACWPPMFGIVRCYDVAYCVVFDE